MKNKTRTILLPPKLCRLLKDYCKQEKITSGMIFITRRGNPVDRSNILHHSSKEVMTDYIARTGETSRTFFRLVNKSLNNIKVMYESRYSNDNLLKMSLSQKKVRKNKAVTPDSSPYKQLSFGLENENQ